MRRILTRARRAIRGFLRVSIDRNGASAPFHCSRPRSRRSIRICSLRSVGPPSIVLSTRSRTDRRIPVDLTHLCARLPDLSGAILRSHERCFRAIPSCTVAHPTVQCSFGHHCQFIHRFRRVDPTLGTQGVGRRQPKWMVASIDTTKPVVGRREERMEKHGWLVHRGHGGNEAL